MGIIQKLGDYIMGVYSIKSTTLTALVITAIDGDVITFCDGTTHTLTTPVTAVVGDYAISLPSTNYTFLTKEFFEGIAVAHLTFEQALAAIKAGKSVKRASGNVIIKYADEAFNFVKDDLEALDYVIVN